MQHTLNTVKLSLRTPSLKALFESEDYEAARLAAHLVQNDDAIKYWIYLVPTERMEFGLPEMNLGLRGAVNLLDNIWPSCRHLKIGEKARYYFDMKLDEANNMAPTNPKPSAKRRRRSFLFSSLFNRQKV